MDEIRTTRRATQSEIRAAAKTGQPIPRRGPEDYFIRRRLATHWFGRERPSRFELDKSGVSPVIAVILMVAITVVLAATVFVLVSDIGVPKAGPVIGFTEDKARGNLTVQQAPSGLLWGDFTVSGCGYVPTGTVDAGDSLGLCRGEVAIRHNPSNSLVYRGTF